MVKQIEVLDLGLSRYLQVWELQKKLVEKLISGKGNEVLILVEHYPVYTLGKSAKFENILNKEEAIREGIEIIEVDRGGDVFYHGPGQLVAYPILKLSNYGLNIRGYVRLLEEVMIRTLAGYGIKASRMKGYPGVWVGNSKIGAIGLRIVEGVSMHGIALNVNPNMRHFSYIVSCGLKGMGVTSMENILGYKVPIDNVKRIFIKNFADVFGVRLSKRELEV